MKFTGLFLLLFSLTLTLQAQVPSAINFQGNLTDPGTGNAIADGAYDMDFSLFDANIDGVQLWSESQLGVSVQNGIFNVILGSVNQLDPAVFNQPVWLEITINAETLGPRIELASTAYSQAAKSLIGDNFIPNTGNVHIGGDLDVGGVAPTIDLAIDDDDTGLDVPADGTLSFYTDGVERMILDNIGTLSIGNQIAVGTTGKLLEINTDPAGTGFGGMYITNSAASAKPYYGYQINGGATTAFTYLDGADGNKWKLYNLGDRITVQPNGNVGIGTTTPPERLSVSGNIASSDTVKADVFAYNNEKIKYYSITPREFREYVVNHNPTSTATSFPHITGFYYLYGTGGTVGSGTFDLLAPVHLPQGAIIKDITMYLYDNDATYDFYGSYLYGVQLSTGSSIVSPSIGAPSSETTSVQELTYTALNHQVDNSANSYWLYVWMPNAGSNLRIYGAKISYVEPGF